MIADYPAQLRSAGDNIKADPSGWTFGGDTPKTFSIHIARSVPFYDVGHKIVEQLSDFFIKKDSISYEIGTATGTLVRRLASRHDGRGHWIAVDAENAMIEEARREHSRVAAIGSIDYQVLDACDIEFENCDLVIAFYTVQFVNPRRRQELINSIFRALNWGGGFIMFEKVRAPDARFQDMMSSLYIDFKLANGYSPSEIITKANSLKGVLEPFSTNGNLDLLRRAGFSDITTVFKYLCFEGFLAIK